MDVPNDQGRQVNVVWSRFGGDGVSDNPVQVYYVWRKVDAASKNLSVFKSLNDVPLDPSSVSKNAAIQLGDDLWTVVGSSPAAAMGNYAAVVPTLGDSTAKGVVMSTFVVTGHTSVPQVYAISNPVTGYSIDNLAPMAPAGVMAKGANNTEVQLSWQAPVDRDVDFVAVYRSTVKGFDPTGMEPLAKVTKPEFRDETVDPAQTYYYRLAAFDLSGNRSAFSVEVQAAVNTGVDQMAGVPTTFELGQNYPNPFNPSTMISFSVPEAGQVSISVFDISGKEVGSVVSRYMSPGRYQVSWQAGNLASGVYLYKMEAHNFVQVKSMLLLK
jgi:hypothetical protein